MGPARRAALEPGAAGGRPGRAVRRRRPRRPARPVRPRRSATTSTRSRCSAGPQRPDLPAARTPEHPAACARPRPASPAGGPRDRATGSPSATGTTAGEVETGLRAAALPVQRRGRPAIDDGDLLVVAVRDDDDAMVAGLFGWTWGGTGFVDLLHVAEGHRGAGLGSRLLTAAEEEGARRGLHAGRPGDAQLPGARVLPVRGYVEDGRVERLPGRPRPDPPGQAAAARCTRLHEMRRPHTHAHGSDGSGRGRERLRRGRAAAAAPRRTPSSSSARSRPAAAAGRPVTDAAPAAPAAAPTTFGHRPTADRARRGRRGLPGPARTASPPRSSPSCRRTCRSSTSAPTSGSPTRPAWDTLLRRHPRRHLGLRAARAARGARARSPAASRVANPGCYPTAVALGARAAAGRRAWSSRPTSSSSPRRAPPAPAASLRPHLLGQRGDGRPVGVQGRRGPPAHARDGAGPDRRRRRRRSRCRSRRCWRRCRAGSSRPARRGSRPGTHRGSCATALHAAYDDEPFVHVLPEGAWPTTAATLGSNAVHLQVAADAHAGRAVVVAALDNLVKGAAGQAVQNANLVLGLDETAGLSAIGDRAVSVTAAAGLPRGRRRRRAQDQRRCSTSRWSSTTARRTRPPASSPPTGSRPRRCSGRSRCSRDGRVDAVVLNSGGANACTGPAGFQDTHAHRRAGRRRCSASRAGDVAVCSTGLIGERLPMDQLLAGVDAAVAAARRRRCRRRGARDHDHRHRAQAGRSSRGDGFTVGGMAKGAGMLAPGLATMLVVLTTDADVRRRRRSTRRCARPPRTTFDRVDSDGCMSTNDTVLLLASPARPGWRRRRADARRRGRRGLRRPRPPAGRRRRGRHARTSRSTVVHAADEARRRRRSARAVARSNLLKCAIHGEDPNWGRVLAAVGTTDADVRARPARRRDQRRLGLPGRRGRPRTATQVDLSGREVAITIDLARRRRRRPRSGPTTSPPRTSTRTRRTRHERADAPRRAGTPLPWRRPPSSSRRCPGSSASTAGPSWSSTAATR